MNFPEFVSVSDQGSLFFLEIPAPDYNIVVPDQVIDEVINEQEQFEAIEALRPNYEVEELKLKIDTLQDNLDQERADKKQLEEKYKQLEAKQECHQLITSQQYKEIH